MKVEKQPLTIEDVNGLLEMLTGGALPEGMIMDSQPRLSRKEAFGIIWFLQEHLGILPDNFEMCEVCEQLFDSHSEGYIIDGTDDPDEHYEDMSITKTMLEENDGKMFCSIECESKYWRRKG